MKFKSILSRSGQGLLNARATNIANIVKAEQEQVIATYKREAQRLINELTAVLFYWACSSIGQSKTLIMLRLSVQVRSGPRLTTK